jgi:hypothetical protein
VAGPSRWYPSREQLGDPGKLEQAFRQLLTQHYELQDRVKRMSEDRASGETGADTDTSGPSTTKLLGLRVAPVDVQTLADGAKLTFVKKAGNFQFL